MGKVVYITDKFIELHTKYKLIRNNVVNNVIGLPALANTKNLSMLRIKLFLKQYSNTIENFTKVLENKFPKENLWYLYNNLKDIKIKMKNLEDNFSGQYLVYCNLILLEDINALNHELFHMATSIKTPFISRCGFHYFKNNGSDLGKAINEGYTEIMTARYFNGDILETSGYENEIEICEFIEELVGKESMESLYLNANLPGLIEELKKYIDEKQVITLLTKIDEILIIRRNKNLFDFERQEKINNIKLSIKIFLSHLIMEKNGEDIKIKENITDFYTNNGEEVGKDFYSKCLTLLNKKNNKSEEHLDTELKKMDNFFRIIGYDKLKETCFGSGIKGLIEELKKYFTEEDAYKYIKLYEHNLTTDVEKWFFQLNSIEFCMYVKEKRMVEENIKISINPGFKFNEKTNMFLGYEFMIEDRNKNPKDYEDYENVWIKLENIIGKDKLLKLYITGDTIGFVKELKKYFDVVDIKKLLDSESMYEFEENIKEMIFAKQRDEFEIPYMSIDQNTVRKR